jgi:bifunctional UDP-N-acetylglucosamine pyrophosphorylase / glucosamine-1-phosphate N-acetyltransferase
MVKRLQNRGLAVVVLAAGKGTRMESDLAKVLHSVAGATMLTHVLSTAKELKPDRIAVVVGHQAEAVRKAHAHFSGIVWARQKQMRGTGDAVRSVASSFSDFDGPVLVLYGDTPGIKVETLRRLAMLHGSSANAVTLLTAELEDPTGYGRIVLEVDGSVARIVEEKDASMGEKEISEVNTGIGIWDSKFLFSSLQRLKPTNQQREYYLTDVVEMARRAGKTVGRLRARDNLEILGINSQEDLTEVSRIMFEDKALSLLKSGVTLEDPSTTSVEPTVEIAKDSRLAGQIRISGSSKIGSGVRIGPNCEIENSEIQADVELESGVKLKNARIGTGSRIASNSTIG